MDTEEDFAKRLGAAIRQARTGRQWSQAVLAERLDCSTDYVGMLERGERLPSFVVLFQIARLFGVPPLDLLSPGPEDPWVGEALSLLRALPEGSRDVVMSMLRGVAGAVPKLATEKPEGSRGGKQRKA